MRMPHTTLEFNPEFSRAYDLMEHTQKNIFITGRAGTGKSTLLRHFRLHTKKKLVVLAPTGVAAVNVSGQTIHSFFGFKPDITIQKARKVRPRKAEVYKNLQTIVIDEISMVRADLMDCIDAFLRKWGPYKGQPFGGVQMIFIGDLYQLPPVVTSREKSFFTCGYYESPYFFSAHSITPPPALLAEKPFCMELVELEKVYRQRDDAFIALLNAIRNNTAEDDHIVAINARCDTAYDVRPQAMDIHLMTTNAMANDMNERMIESLSEKERVFRAVVDGGFDEKSYPTDALLRLKIGAQVMMQNNDIGGKWINGTMGKVLGFASGYEAQNYGAELYYESEEEHEEYLADKTSAEHIIIQLQDGQTVVVSPHRWDMYEFHFDRHTGSIESNTVGSFVQYPVRLAWAVTIHKAQGKTFDRVVLDIGRGTFAPGQLYVALSRCTTLGGLVLRRPIAKHHVWTDRKVVSFMTGFQYRVSEEALPLEEKIVFITQAIQKKQTLEIIYLKAKDEKSVRSVRPFAVGEREYKDKIFIGMDAYCLSRKNDRVFRVDRILHMRVLES